MTDLKDILIERLLEVSKNLYIEVQLFIVDEHCDEATAEQLQELLDEYDEVHADLISGAQKEARNEAGQ